MKATVILKLIHVLAAIVMVGSNVTYAVWLAFVGREHCTVTEDGRCPVPAAAGPTASGRTRLRRGQPPALCGYSPEASYRSKGVSTSRGSFSWHMAGGQKRDTYEYHHEPRAEGSQGSSSSHPSRRQVQRSRWMTPLGADDMGGSHRPPNVEGVFRFQPTLPHRPRRMWNQVILLERGRAAPGDDRGRPRAHHRHPAGGEGAPDRPRAAGAHGPHEARPGPIPPAEPDRRTGLRPGHGGPRDPTLPTPGSGRLRRRVEAHRRDQQPAGVVAEWPASPNRATCLAGRPVPGRAAIDDGAPPYATEVL